MTIEICLTNLGKYNEGELIYSRLVLPATTEEIQAAYDEIGVAENTMYEEAFISDYETDVNGLSISEYASIDDLNELSEELSNLDEYELEAFGAMLDAGLDTDEALQKVQDGEYRIYDGCYSMAEVAERKYNYYVKPRTSKYGIYERNETSCLNVYVGIAEIGL